MTKRKPISATQNVWFDAEQVDNTDLSLEQQYNTTIQSSLINNHIGIGVVPEVLTQNILFDSSLVATYMDGVNIQPQNQPADTNLGNQLEIELLNSKAASKRTVKLCVIGLDFDSNLQYETFVFCTNEIQISKKHFTNILVLLFNDFVGDPAISLNLGGQVIIREAKPMTLSRDPVMLAQDVEPNLFFRDFIPSSTYSLQALLQACLPTYNIDNLNINTSALEQQILLVNDITTQIGQKFIATTNNIQKISLLLSVRNQEVGFETDLSWTGDLVVSVYALQSNIECPTDIAPNLAIEFSPSNIPIAQISINYSSLSDMGIVLDSVPQPVDFVFSNSPIAAGNLLTVGSYYAFTIKRAGSANKCDILMDVGSDTVDNSRITIFTGTVWVDLPEEDLWFRIYTDAAKISDGQGYDSGNGLIITKTYLDPITQVTSDYCYSNIQFVGNDVYKAVVSAVTQKSDTVADARTGQPVNSRQQLVPSVQLLNTLDVANLEAASEPLIIGAISDKNKKSFDSSSSLILSKLHAATIVNEDILIRVVDDTTDVVRYDTTVTALESNLLNGDLVDAKIYPNTGYPGIYYRIAEAKLCSMILGDVNGDGIIDTDDLDLLNSYVGYNLNAGLPLSATVTTDSVHTTFTNGYNTYISAFSNAFGLSFQVVDPITNDVMASGVDGVLVANPTDSRLAQFTSTSVSFIGITGLSGYKLVILTSTSAENYGGFDITSIDTLTDVITIRKVFLDGDVLAQMLRADIDGDFYISTNDGYLLESYIDRATIATSQGTVYPAPTSVPYSKIGTRFNVIRIKVQKFVDRTDDYSSVTINRADVIHPLQDVYASDGYYPGNDFYYSPVNFSIQKQLTWDDYLIVSNSRAKQVPSAFTTLTGFTPRSCSLDGVLCNTFPTQLAFDSGRVDLFVPDNIIIGESGELQRPDGSFYKVDFEVGTIVLEIPNGLYGDERTIDIIRDFIASALDGSGLPTGLTVLGFPAMKFADCTYVDTDSLSNDQIRFSVAVQSFSPNTNGYGDGYSGAIVDGKMGVSIDYSTGLLTLNFTNLYQDAILRTLSTKIQISVYLKKSGFNNTPLYVNSTQVQNMLSLISIFSGAVDGGPSALVDIETDVTGILPIINGGTGLNSVGIYGTVLASTGSGLSYQFITDLASVIAYSTGIPDADKIPKTDGYGRLDPSFNYKNPVYIYGCAGTYANDSSSPIVIGALVFKFDQYILQGLTDIRLEAIIETTNASNNAIIKLYNVSTSSYLILDTISTELYTANTVATYVTSSDLKYLLSSGTSDFIYEIHLRLNPGSATETAICKMARLVMTYDNPTNVTPPLANSYNFVPYAP